MAAKPSLKSDAWKLFDYIVAQCGPLAEVHSNPWVKGPESNYASIQITRRLSCLLGVPLHLKAGTQTEFQRSPLMYGSATSYVGRVSNQVRCGPRPTNPRVLPAAVTALINSLPG